MSAQRRKPLGANVRALRLAKGLSQEAFVHACDLHRTYIGSIERGERNISLENLERIADALAVDLPELLSLTYRVVDAASTITSKVPRT